MMVSIALLFIFWSLSCLAEAQAVVAPMKRARNAMKSYVRNLSEMTSVLDPRKHQRAYFRRGRHCRPSLWPCRWPSCTPLERLFGSTPQSTRNPLALIMYPHHTQALNYLWKLKGDAISKGQVHYIFSPFTIKSQFFFNFEFWIC